MTSSFLRITLWSLLLTFFTKKRWYLSILFDGLSVITLPNDTSNKRRLMCIAECKSLGGPQSYLWLPLLIKLSVFWRSDRQTEGFRPSQNKQRYWNLVPLLCQEAWQLHINPGFLHKGFGYFYDWLLSYNNWKGGLLHEYMFSILPWIPNLTIYQRWYCFHK